MIRPDQVYRTRAALGISLYTMARVLGVDEATVDSWEMAREPLRVMHSSEQLLAALAQAASTARDPGKLGHAMTEAMLRDGPMAALYLALHAIYWRTAPGGRS